MRPDIYQQIKSRCPFTDRGDTVWSYATFLQIHGRWPRLRSIPGFNDGLLRVKLHERDNQLRHQVTDKEFAKIYFADRLGETYVVPTIGVLHDQNELHDWPFPDQCMIKPTNASGPFMPRHNGEPLDHKVLQSFFHQNHYRWTREKFYKHLQPKIMVEEFIDFNDSSLPPDLKLFCFFGKVKIIQWDRRDGPDGLVKRWYTPDWKPLDFVIRGPLMPVVERPVNLADLIAAAEVLAADFSSVRVDLYSDGNRILVGELTHVDGNATGPFFPDPRDEFKLGRLFTDSGVTVEDLIGEKAHGS